MSDRVLHAGGFHPAQAAAQLQTRGGELAGSQPRGVRRNKGKDNDTKRKKLLFTFSFHELRNLRLLSMCS